MARTTILGHEYRHDGIGLRFTPDLVYRKSSSAFSK